MSKICPISDRVIDSVLVKVMSFITLTLVILSCFFFYWIFVFLAIDFLLRIFTKFSPIKKLAEIIIKSFKIKKGIPLDLSPKKFSAGIGFVFSKIIFELMFFDLIFLAQIFAIIFIIAISLETFFNYCLGCKLYSFFCNFKKSFFKNKK